MNPLRKIYTIISLFFCFIVFNIFISITSNSYFVNSLIKQNYFFTVVLKKDISNEKISEFEKKILNEPGVTGVKFLSKEEAFSSLQKELEIVIPKSENPLNNSLVVYFKNEKSLEEAEIKLDVDPMIREIDVDDTFIEKLKLNIEVTSLVFYVFLSLSIMMLLPTLTIIRNLIVNDYLYVVSQDKLDKLSYYRFFNFLIVIITGATSTLMFLNLYIMLIERLRVILPNIIILSFQQELIIQMIAMAILTIVTFFPTHIKFKRGQ